MKRSSSVRILMTADTMGGVWTYATGLASALADLGADVYLVSMGPKPRADQLSMLSTPKVHVIESDLALEWQDPDGHDLARAREYFSRLEGQIGPDVVHLNSFREATFDWRAPVLVVAHSCVNSWGAACSDTAWLSEPRWRHYSALVSAGLNHADAWVAPTRAFHGVMKRIYRPRTLGMVISNGAASAIEMPESKARFILAAGRMWDAAKNLAALAQAGTDLDWPVFVAGTTAKTVGKLGLGIEILGELSHSELRARMQRAAIFVSPARYEPFGLSVLEAAHAGCALVLSDIPTFRELWNEAALFVHPDDIEGLRRSLADLCSDQRKRSLLQRAASRRAQRYGTAQMAAAYAELYLGLISSRATSRRQALEVHA
jgi:glycosyltransferase involved in cell wall biosynthesis